MLARRLATHAALPRLLARSQYVSRQLICLHQAESERSSGTRERCDS